MGISSAIFQTELPNTASEDKRLLLNVERAPDHKKTIATEHEYLTRLPPKADRKVFREFQSFVTIGKPELVVLSTLGPDGYVRVHSMRRRCHGRADVQGALSLALHMGEYEIASVVGTSKPDMRSLNVFLRQMGETYPGETTEYAFVGLTKNGFKKSGRDELLTEALYAFVCGRDIL